jgi:hypothetical protein
MRVRSFGEDPNPIRRGLRRLLGRPDGQQRLDWRPSPEVLADWESVRAILQSPLIQVLGVGRPMLAADVTVDLLAIEIRQQGAVIHWRARSAREAILLSADVSVVDDRGTSYHVVHGGGSGSAEAWEGQTHFLPAPRVDTRLTITLKSFGPNDHIPLPTHVPTDRVEGPWLFEVEIPSRDIP